MKKFKAFDRLIIITIICSILTFAYIYIFEEDLSYWKAKEENFKILENTANQIIEEKSFVHPLPKGIRDYQVSVNRDGTTNISLYSNHVENIHITLSKDFNIIEIERSNGIVLVILVHIVYCFAIGFIVSTIINIVYLIIKLIIQKTKEKKQ